MDRIKQMWDTLRQKLKSRPKSTQSKAFVRVLQFFAVMLVLTLFARGAAGVTMARVTARSPYSAEISETVRTQGTVSPQGVVDVDLPAGLTVSRVIVSLGSSVKVGDELLEFDTDELRRSLTLADADLKELQLQLRELQNTEGVSDQSVKDAQKALERAESALTTAHNEENAAKSAYDSAKKAYDNKVAEGRPSDNTTSSSEGEKTPGEQYDEDLAALKSDMDLKKSEWNSATSLRETAEQAVEDARDALKRAQEAYEKDKQTQGIADERNKIAIEKKRLEIEAQQETVDTLRAAQNAGGVLTSPVEGTISDLGLVAGDETSEATKIRITTSDDGFVALVPISQQDAAKLQVGSSVFVERTGSYYNYEGTVVSKYMDKEANQMMARVSLPGSDWTEGEGVDVSVVLSKRQYYTCVPISAVHSGADGNFVYALEERKTVLGTQLVAVKVSVTVSAQDSENVAIEGDVYGRDILTGSSKPVNEGDRVRIEESVDTV